MQATNGFHLSSDIGGPMDITEGYRWNVPVLTYGFDSNFLAFFGSNGVAAVESAIRVINELPSASNIDLSAYPLNARRVNYQAQAAQLHDLKSQALSFLVAHLGLADPARYIFALKQWDPLFIQPGVFCPGCESQWPPGTVPNLILERNFDPVALAPSHLVNSNLYSAVVRTLLLGPQPYYLNEIDSYLVDPFGDYYSAVAQAISEGGGPDNSFWTGLSRDDAGGLRFLLSATNVNFEYLPPDVRGSVTNSGAYVNGAWRPGVEKLTLVPQPYDALLGRFMPSTNVFVDAYLTNGVLSRQQVQRITVAPDFLFCADDESADAALAGERFTQSDTSTWQDNAIANGDSIKAGPGTILPPVRITFHRVGLSITTDDFSDGLGSLAGGKWGDFDSTNSPRQYPDPSYAASNVLNVRLFVFPPYPETTINRLAFPVQVQPGHTATAQYSTNLTDWISVITVTNDGTALNWFHARSAAQRFFRVVPQ